MLISGFLGGAPGLALGFTCSLKMCVLWLFRAHFTFFDGAGFVHFRHLPDLPTLDVVRCGLADFLGYAPLDQGCEEFRFNITIAPLVQAAPH